MSAEWAGNGARSRPVGKRSIGRSVEWFAQCVWAHRQLSETESIGVDEIHRGAMAAISWAWCTSATRGHPLNRLDRVGSTSA
jgi:hypothetical protein